MSQAKELDFYVEDGIAFRKDSEGNWVSAMDPAQPNPDYIKQYGIIGLDKLFTNLKDLEPGVAMQVGVEDETFGLPIEDLIGE